MTACAISGVLKGADGVPLVGATVQFKRIPLELVGVAGAVISGGTISAVTGALGSISLELEPGTYIVSYSFFGEMNVAQALVPALPTADFADIFENPVAPILPSYLQAAIDAKNQTVELAAQVAMEADATVEASVLAQSARDAALLSRGLFASTAQGIGRGLRAVVITAGGTGGTNGTATWVASGGTATITARGTATIAGGAVVAVTVDQPGLYTVDPTGITLTGAGALTGQTFALTVGANTPLDGYFSVAVSGSDTAATLYRVDAGPAATAVTTYASASIATALREARLALGLPVTMTKFLESAGSITPSIFRAHTPTNGVIYELVARVKAADGRNQFNMFNNGGFAINADFDLSAGTSVATVGTTTMTYLGGGVWELVTRNTAVSTTSGNNQLRPSPAGVRPFTGDVAKGVFVESIVLRVVGTTTNLFPSSDPANAAFTKTSLTPTPTLTTEAVLGTEVRAAGDMATANNVVINGTNSLWAMTEAVAGSGKSTRVYQAMTGIVSGSSYKVRIRGKAGTRGRIGLYTATALLASVSINLENGAATDHGAATVKATRYLINGAWECDVTIVAAASGTANLQIWTLDAASVPGTARVSDGVSIAYLQSVEVFKDGGANILLAPTDFASASWIKDASVTMTPNAGTYLGVFGKVPSASTHPLAGKKVSVVGTSLVAQGLMTAAFASETGATVQALGYSGGSLGLDARGSPHYGSGQVTALLTSIAADSDAIIIDMLVNDVAAADVPLGVPTDTTTATYCGALANAFIWCEANRPNAQIAVVVQTSADPTYATSDYRHGAANANGNFLEDFQNATRRMADYYGRPYIDPSRFGVGFLDMEPTENTSDGLHWDASGASRVAKIYAKATRELCEAGWLG